MPVTPTEKKQTRPLAEVVLAANRREVVGLYPTAAARRQGRKTVIWTVVVKDDPRFRGTNEIELRFIRESDRWRLDYMLSTGDTS